jgi:hypothetical protein
MDTTIIAAVIGAAATVSAALIVKEKGQRKPSEIGGEGKRKQGRGALVQIAETDDARRFRIQIGPFLDAIDGSGGAVTRSQFSALGQKYGYDARGLGGFASGNDPSIRSEGEMRVLTERGKGLARRWREQHGKAK